MKQEEKRLEQLSECKKLKELQTQQIVSTQVSILCYILVIIV